MPFIIIHWCKYKYLSFKLLYLVWTIKCNKKKPLQALKFLGKVDDETFCNNFYFILDG